MECNSCGRSTSNEDANFCDYCGASYKEKIFVKSEDTQSNNDLNRESSVVEAEEKTVSFGNWMGTLLLPFIPIVGGIANFGMMLVWAFGSDTSTSKKNWAKANLIVMIIRTVIAILVIILFIALCMDSYMELVNNGFNIESYMNEYY